ncbi:MAG: hypothetical protein ACTSYN_02350 [Candidatus Heimdallarchaeaceae archaeon]
MSDLFEDSKNEIWFSTYH